MSQPSVSVIVPIYNARATLRRCVCSIAEQSCKDFELILVDDGSTDGSSALCDELAGIDIRIRVIHKPNGGVGSARNAGLNSAAGRWAAFVDADDTVLPHYLSAMTDAVAGEVNPVVVQKRFEKGGSDAVSASFSGEDIVSAFLDYGLYREPFPYKKLFSLDVIRRHGVAFPEDVHLGEDKIFFLRYLAVARSLVVVNDNQYCYDDYGGHLSKMYYTIAREHYGYRVLREALFAFLTRNDKTKDDKRLAWQIVFNYNFYRCLICTGRRQKGYSLAQQLKEYEDVYKADGTEFREYYRPSSFKNRIVRRLFLRKRYKSLIAFNRFYFVLLHVLKRWLRL